MLPYETGETAGSAQGKAYIDPAAEAVIYRSFRSAAMVYSWQVSQE